jgi:hypothetical protein
MPAGEDEAMTNKPAPHDAAESGRMPAGEDKAMTTKPAPHDAAASGRMPADEDEARGKEAGAPCNTMRQPTEQEGRNERRRRDERGREGQEARKCDATRQPNKWRGVKRGGGAD